MSLNRKGQMEQRSKDQMNGSYLGLSNNPSSHGQSQGRSNTQMHPDFMSYKENSHAYGHNNLKQSLPQFDLLQTGNPFDQPMIINPGAIGAGFDSTSQSRDHAMNNQNTDSLMNSKESLNFDSEDPQYLADLNLFMNTTKEQCEEELQRIEKRLGEVQQNITNIQHQIKE